MIGLAPSEFWEMSPREAYTAIAGFSEFNSSGEEQQKPLQRGELEKLMELYPD